MGLTNNQQTFLELVRAGLWEREVRLLQYEGVDYSEVYQLADEQSVVGLLAAGIDHVSDVKLPQNEVLTIVGSTLQLEQRNEAMNQFVKKLFSRFKDEEIYAVLIKGQGVAQCYERPNWRAAGDIDLFLDKENYEKTKRFLSKYGIADTEDKERLHIGYSLEGWTVELHGTMHTGISNRINVVVDEVQNDIFRNRGVRAWKVEENVCLPKPDNDVIIVYTHFLNHFYGEGIGLRQISDWCRLLWAYRQEIDLKLLKERISRAGLMTEWKAFGTFAVEYLGMPAEAMPFYKKSAAMRKKAGRICKLILKTGNFGVNKDESYRGTSTKMKSNVITFWRRLCEFARLATIFPVNAPKFFVSYVTNRAKAVL